MNKSKKVLIIVSISVAATMATMSVMAQGNPAGPGYDGSGIKANGQSPTSSSGGAGAPIDGGASILIAATVAYTGRKLAKMREQIVK